MTRYLYQHNVLPYAPKLEFTPDQVNIIIPILCCHLDYKIMDKMCEEMSSSDPYDLWMYLWVTFGDPAIPPFPQDLLPLVVAITSLDEITPPPSVASTNPIPATNALDSM